MSQEIATNRKAFHDYEILETFEAGISLLGTEVKSLRNHGGNIAEGYVKIIRDEIWLVGASIIPYKYGNVHNHEERRDRKLLMHKKEIEQLQVQVMQKGLALVPLSLYFKQGKVKVKIGLGRGRKKVDKRHAIKEKEEKRRLSRTLKKFR